MSRAMGHGGVDGAMDATQALAELRQGNARYAAGSSGAHEREASGSVPPHEPLAVVIGCSDARVPVGQVMDQPPGSLFVVRVAGHVLEPAALASVVYAVGELGARLVVVLGHQGCGAVAAALAGVDDEALEPLVAPIALRLAAAGASDADEPGAVRANVTQAATEVVAHLETALPAIADDVTVSAGVASLESGLIDWLTP